jgi:hypothetical protein
VALYSAIVVLLARVAETREVAARSAGLVALVGIGAGVSLVLGVGLAWLVHVEGERLLIVAHRSPLSLHDRAGITSLLKASTEAYGIDEYSIRPAGGALGAAAEATAWGSERCELELGITEWAGCRTA